MSDGQSVRLHCFAHSEGGVSVFDHWAADTGHGVDVAPVPFPGGGRRDPERRVTTHEALLTELLPRFTGPRSGPYALYGHGLGAMVAFTVTRALHEAGLPGPAFLAVGACPPPPHVPAELPDARAATDAELLDILGGKGAVPPSSDEGIWLRAMLPVLRADLELAQALDEAARKPSSAGPLTTPILVVASQGNPLAPAGIADGWQQWTAGPSWLRTVPDRHFFVRGHALPRLLGRACRVAHRLTHDSVPVG
ncbi:surfactin synthase thioesterase subunit [Streptomyces sp. TLI_55]|uniref:thioesterase II family protein n=1 Tax=Streptomyces sp. TLI_55 TaxID=1938861 RepID=UPI000BCD740E|nr:thioesterase domain-containing protein [Streptomyces sp. TLI_55]SNX88249.1 surfactin synthase thioesterase subunit [Streptomyces sp. TLI_55]